MFKESQGAGVELASGNDVKEAMEGHEGFCMTSSFSLSEERSDDPISYQNLAVMLRTDC